MIHGNISQNRIIATPGRLLHIMVETGLSLKRVEYVVFDEADRLFEMGLSEQLYQIIDKLPQTRQTLLFSATLPTAVAEFSKAGLNQPELIRLDSDIKVSDTIRLSSIFMRSNEKYAALIYLLNNIISNRESTIIFIPTRHHAEYLLTLFSHYKIDATVVYGSMDQQARTENLEKFRNGEVNILLVTDVAARGIDIPEVNNVINFNFPGKPKLFVHRVGRVGRAGKIGTAYSLVGPDEIPFFLDLELFLGRKSKNVVLETIYEDDETKLVPADLTGRNWRDYIDGYFGTIPQSIIDREIEQITKFESIDQALKTEGEVCTRAMQLYNRTRGEPSGASIARSKEYLNLSIHPMIKIFEVISDEEEEQHDILTQMKNYRPGQSIFEYKEKEKSPEAEVMRKRRQFLKQAQVLKQVRDYAVVTGVESDHEVEMKENREVSTTFTSHDNNSQSSSAAPKTPKTLAEKLLSESSKQERFVKLSTMDTNNSKSKKKEFRDPNFFMDYGKEEKTDSTQDHYSLNGASNKKKKPLTNVVSSEFNEITQLQINDAVMDIGGETRDELNKQQRKKQGMIWDRKKGKYVVGVMGVDGKVRRDDNKKNDDLKTTDAYAKWKKRTHGRIQQVGEVEERQDFVSGKRGRTNDNEEEYYNGDYDGGDDGDEVTLTNNKKRKKAPWEEKNEKNKKRKLVKEGKAGKEEVKSEAQLKKIRKEMKKKQQHNKVKGLMKRHGAQSVLNSIQRKGMIKALEQRNAMPNRNSKGQVRIFKRRK